MVRKYLGFLLCIAVLLSCFGAASGVTASAANIQTGNVIATYGQTEARSMLASINELRKPGNAWYWNSDDTTKSTPTDLADLTYDYELERYAMQRAAEIAVSFSHTRPDGSDCFTVYTGSYNSKGENIAYGVNTMDKAAQAFEAWCETDDPYSGQGHRRNMLSGNFTSVGIGYATVNGKHCWVQEFGRPNSGAAYTAPLDGDKTVSIRYDADTVNYPYFVSDAPEITAQPAGVKAAVGATASFKVTASGTGLAYQWQSSADNGKTWTDSKFSTAKAATLKVPVTAARNGYKYRCVVTGSNGKKATSSAAGLTVKTTVTAKPASVKKAVGDTAAFTVEATGPKLTYQWQSSADNGKTWTNSGFSTAKTATLKVPVTAARNGYKYRCKVTGANGSVTTSAATLTVLTKITAQPASVKNAVGATASFKVEATGVKLTYQWQYSTNGTTWKNSGFSTAKSATLNVPVTAARNGYRFRCVVTGSNGQTATSNAAKLTVS